MRAISHLNKLGINKFTVFTDSREHALFVLSDIDSQYLSFDDYSSSESTFCQISRYKYIITANSSFSFNRCLFSSDVFGFNDTVIIAPKYWTHYTSLNQQKAHQSSPLLFVLIMANSLGIIIPIKDANSATIFQLKRTIFSIRRYLNSNNFHIYVVSRDSQLTYLADVLSHLSCVSLLVESYPSHSGALNTGIEVCRNSHVLVLNPEIRFLV